MGIMRQRAGKLDEIGTTGLSTYSGWIDQAYIHELTWPAVAPTYARIWRSDPEVTIARNLYGALAGKVTVSWEFPEERGNKELPKPTAADEKFLDFLYSNNDDMRGGIGQWVTDCITRTPFYGYGIWETVLGMRRKGWKGDDGWTSQENDGLIGIRNLAFRDYATFYRWQIDDKTGRATAWEQNDQPNPIRAIPLDRCIHMLYGDLSNPEGLATLEAMYRLERYKYNLEITQGIGFEHTAGFLYYEADRPLTDNDKPWLRDGARYVLTAQEGNFLAMPGGIKASFIDTPFGAAAQILESIRHYSVLKLALLGLQFVAISTLTGSGSYAALDDSSSVAMLMYNSMTVGFARQAGKQIVDQLLRANPGAFQGITRKPVMTISPITKNAALGELAQFVQAMNAIRPLGDDDLVSIRKQSEVLPVTLPEVEDDMSDTTGTTGATMPAGDESAPENIESTKGLNGAQISAALKILEGVATGATAPAVAIELLVSLGVERGKAVLMVNATSKSGKPAIAPPEPTEPEQPVVNEDDTMTTPDGGEFISKYDSKMWEEIDKAAQLSEPVIPKGKAVTLPDSASKVTPDDAAAAVAGFKKWAEKNAPKFASLLDADVED